MSFLKTPQAWSWKNHGCDESWAYTCGDMGPEFLHLSPDAKVLDCGCGGGANMKRLRPQGIVKGIDYSPRQCGKSKKDEAAIAGGTLCRPARQRGGYDLRR